MIQSFRVLKPGQAPSAKEWNDLVAFMAQTMGTATGTAFGSVGVSRGHGGLQILDGRINKHWARITGRGTGNAYEHHAVAPNSDGTWTDLPKDSENPWGTPTNVPAREVNGRVDLDGAIPFYAEVWPDESTFLTPGFRFVYQGISDETSGSGSGSGNLDEISFRFVQDVTCDDNGLTVTKKYAHIGFNGSDLVLTISDT